MKQLLFIGFKRLVELNMDNLEVGSGGGGGGYLPVGGVRRGSNFGANVMSGKL